MIILVVFAVVILAITAAGFIFLQNREREKLSQTMRRQKKKMKLSHNSHFRYVILLSGENVLAYPQTYFYPSTQSIISGRKWCSLHIERRG